jgi:PAS domain S-box-containing protein
METLAYIADLISRSWRNNMNKNSVLRAVPIEVNSSEVIKNLCLFQAAMQFRDHAEPRQNKYAELYEFAPIAHFIFDDTGMIKEVNYAGAELIGLDKALLQGRCLSRYISPDYLKRFNEHCAAALDSTAVCSCEIKILKKNTDFVYAQLYSKSTTNEDGRKELCMFIADTTSQHRLEEVAHQQQELMSFINHNSSLAHLAANISSEINRPLGVVINYLYGCIRRLEHGNYDVNDLITVLKRSVQQSHKVSETILRVKNIFCQGDLDLEEECLNDVIKETVATNNLAIDEITIDYCFPSFLPPVVVD